MWYYLFSAVGGQIFSGLALWLSGFLVGMKVSLITVLSMALCIGSIVGVVVCLLIEFVYNKWIRPKTQANKQPVSKSEKSK